MCYTDPCNTDHSNYLCIKLFLYNHLQSVIHAEMISKEHVISDIITFARLMWSQIFFLLVLVKAPIKQDTKILNDFWSHRVRRVNYGNFTNDILQKLKRKCSLFWVFWLFLMYRSLIINHLERSGFCFTVWAFQRNESKWSENREKGSICCSNVTIKHHLNNVLLMICFPFTHTCVHM